jgi:hypothetical protein
MQYSHNIIISLYHYCESYNVVIENLIVSVKVGCRMKIGADGLYLFETEQAGNEALSGWGPDPQPHIHFELKCRCFLLACSHALLVLCEPLLHLVHASVSHSGFKVSYSQRPAAQCQCSGRDIHCICSK